MRDGRPSAVCRRCKSLKTAMDRSLLIRLATPDDRPAMVAVINAAFAVENFLDGTRTDHERLAETMAKGHFLLGCGSSGQILASVYVEVCDDRDHGYLGMLAVHPAHQRKGLGRAMVNAAEQWCRQRGCKVMDLRVLSLRSELPPLYRKLGYLECGTEEFHPSRPLKSGVECHCIVMSKRL